MIIGFKTVNGATPGVVEMNAYKDGISLSVFDRDSLIEWDEDIRRARHHCS